MEKDKEKEEKEELQKKGLRTRKGFSDRRPTAARVQKYIDKVMQGKPTSLTGQYFVDYQNLHNWTSSNGDLIKDWKAVVRCWLDFRYRLAQRQAARRDRQTRREQCAERRRQNEQLSQNRQADTQRWLQQKAEHDATAVSYEEYLRMKGEGGKD